MGDYPTKASGFPLHIIWVRTPSFIETGATLLILRLSRIPIEKIVVNASLPHQLPLRLAACCSLAAFTASALFLLPLASEV
jgi:hypothetical protein